MRARRLVSPTPFHMTVEKFDLPDTPPDCVLLAGAAGRVAGLLAAIRRLEREGGALTDRVRALRPDACLGPPRPSAHRRRR